MIGSFNNASNDKANLVVVDRGCQKCLNAATTRLGFHAKPEFKTKKISAAWGGCQICVNMPKGGYPVNRTISKHYQRIKFVQVLSLSPGGLGGEEN